MSTGSPAAAPPRTVVWPLLYAACVLAWAVCYLLQMPQTTGVQAWKLVHTLSNDLPAHGFLPHAQHPCPLPADLDIQVLLTPGMDLSPSDVKACASTAEAALAGITRAVEHAWHIKARSRVAAIPAAASSPESISARHLLHSVGFPVSPSPRLVTLQVQCSGKTPQSPGTWTAATARHWVATIPSVAGINGTVGRVLSELGMPVQPRPAEARCAAQGKLSEAARRAHALAWRLTQLPAVSLQYPDWQDSAPVPDLPALQPASVNSCLQQVQSLNGAAAQQCTARLLTALDQVEAATAWQPDSAWSQWAAVYLPAWAPMALPLLAATKRALLSTS